MTDTQGRADRSGGGRILNVAVQGFILLAVLGFWFALLLLHRFDWDQGFSRGLVLIGLIGIVAIGWRRQKRIPEPELWSIGQASSRLWHLLLILILVWFGFRFHSNYIHSYPADIGRSTVTTIRWFFESGLNPYATPIDMVAPVEPGFRFHDGYKYFPLTLFYYAPFVRVFNIKGLYVGNLVLFLITLAAIYLTSWKIFGESRLHSVIAVILATISPFMIYELFHQGVNDIIPVALIMLSLLCFAHDQETGSALALGLSMSAKYLPGLLLLPLLLMAGKRRILFCLGVAAPLAIIVLPFFIWAPAEFIGTIILYYFERHADSTSIVYYLPLSLKTIWSLVGLVTMVALFAKFHHERNSQGGESSSLVKRIIEVFTMVCMVFCLFTGALHRNYLIWFMPTLALILSDLSVRAGILVMGKTTNHRE